MATFDGTTRRLYLDGALVRSDNPTGHAVPASSFTTFATAYGGYYYTGAMDEVRVWNRALSAAEVATSATRTNPANLLGFVSRWDMHEGSGNTISDALGNSPTGIGTGTPVFTMPGIDYLGAIVALNVNDGGGNTSRAFATVSPCAATTAVARSISVSLGQSSTLTLDPNSVNFGSTVNCAPPTAAQLSLSPATVTCADLVPNDATNKALTFDGSDDYVAIPNGSPLPIGNAVYSIEAWVKPTAMGNGGFHWLGQRVGQRGQHLAPDRQRHSERLVRQRPRLQLA